MQRTHTKLYSKHWNTWSPRQSTELVYVLYIAWVYFFSNHLLFTTIWNIESSSKYSLKLTVTEVDANDFITDYFRDIEFFTFYFLILLFFPYTDNFYCLWQLKFHILSVLQFYFGVSLVMVLSFKRTDLFFIFTG